MATVGLDLQNLFPCPFKIIILTPYKYIFFIRSAGIIYKNYLRGCVLPTSSEWFDPPFTGLLLLGYKAVKDYQKK